MAEKTSVVHVCGVTPETLREKVSECMDACFWRELVPKNGLVVVKPNLCTTVPSKMEMSNTDLALAEAVCEVLKTRTTRILLGESNHLRQTAWQAFRASGYTELVERCGIELVNFTDQPQRKVRCYPVGELGLPECILKADAFITLPVLKTHALTYFTGALKNQWGCVPQHDRILLHKDIDELLPSLHRHFRPCLAIMDAIVGMEGRGPVNGKPRRLNGLLASRDSVALDATAMRLVGLNPDLCRHVKLAAKQHLGNMAADRIELQGEWTTHLSQFEPAVLDRAVAAMNYMTRYPWFVRHVLEKDLIFFPVRSFVQVLRRVGFVAGS